MKIIEFFGILILGFAVLYYAFPLYNITGRVDFIEKYLGPGGTITFYRFLGAALAIFAFIFLIYF